MEDKIKCPRCKKWVSSLTNHSVNGGHKPPFVKICRVCHDGVHEVKGDYSRRSQIGTSGKYAKGTRRSKRK